MRFSLLSRTVEAGACDVDLATLPDGVYHGTIGADCVRLDNFRGVTWTADASFRGMGIPVTVHVMGGAVWGEVL